MSNVGIISWKNETGLQPYPFQKSFGFEGLIVDANFLQWNGVIPVLLSIAVTENTLSFKMVIDSGTKAFIFNRQGLGNIVKFYDNTRYVGKFVFGPLASSVFEQYLNQTISVNTSVLAHTVKKIPLSSGVYMIDGNFGNVQFDHDSNIFYTVNGQNVVFNAVNLPKTKSSNYLKTLNNVGPTNNSVYIQESTKIKVSGSNGVVTISLIGQSSEDAVKNLSRVIPTNPDPK